MADWASLARVLDGVDESMHFRWHDLDDLVGGLPASAAKHRAWWSGDRPHVRVWKSAGFVVRDLVLGDGVTFARQGAAAATMSSRPAAQSDVADDSRGGRILLVTCVKEKLTAPAAARDLYVSALFKRQRHYAEETDGPWFILSAEHGLVAPGEWLAPYDRYLPDTPAQFRRAWALWVVERLELLIGPLRGRTAEIHASAAYVDPLREPLSAKAVNLVEPLAGLTLGERLSWYSQRISLAGEEPPVEPETTRSFMAERFCAELSDEPNATTPTDFLNRGPHLLQRPGLYSWWVDESGADDLTTGLGLRLTPGLIYAGLAGATRWPSGRASSNTLWSRIAGMHLGGRHEFSTFRRTLGSILAQGRGADTIDETALTEWMHAHLKVIAVPTDDPDTLGRLESAVLHRLDPPLNLQGMAASPIRARVKALRRPHGRRRSR